MQVQEDVRASEKRLYSEYKARQAAVQEKHSAGQRALDEDRTKLQADRIYLDECVAHVEQSLGRADSLTEDELEQLERENLAIETEKSQLKEDEERLESRRRTLEVGVCKDAGVCWRWVCVNIKAHARGWGVKTQALARSGCVCVSMQAYAGDGIM